jgi:hypothetical protein
MAFAQLRLATVDLLWPMAYYVCPEALANVAEHAHATRPAITAGPEGHALCIVFVDDGVGGRISASAVAVRGRPSIRATSPRKSPGPGRASRRPSRSTPRCRR